MATQRWRSDVSRSPYLDRLLEEEQRLVRARQEEWAAWVVLLCLTSAAITVWVAWWWPQ